MEVPIGATGPGVPAPVPVAAPAAAAQPAPGLDPSTVRVIDLAPGQQLQATVTAFLGEGLVRLGLLGGTVEASTRLPLELGKSYWFTVAATAPQIVLVAARPAVVPTLDAALASDRLGPSGGTIRDLLAALVQVEPAPAAAGDRQPRRALDGEPLRPGSELAGRLAAGAAGATELAALARTLGHDQEARVLRLLQLPGPLRQAEAVALRGTWKANALRILAQPDAEPARLAAARSLVEGLGQVERENVARAESGAPQWLPLLGNTGGLRDARMFLVTRDPDRGSPARAEDAGVSIVLLLELTRLGAVRVDLGVAGQELRATLTVVEAATMHALQRSLPGLERQWLDAGLRVRDLQLRLAPQGRLPVADLVRPPRSSDPDAMVDVHA